MSNELPVKKKSKTIARVGMPDKADKAPARVYRIVDKVRSVAEQVVLVQNADMTSVETPQKPTSKKTKEKSGKSPFAEVNRNARTESEMLEPEPSLAKAMTPSQELSEAVLKVAHRREREIKQEQKRVENARESKVIEREIDSAFVEVLAVQKEVRSTKNKLNSSDVEILQKMHPSVMNATKWLASKLNLSIQKKITLEKTTAEAYPDAPKEFKGITISDSNVLQYVVPEAIDSKIVEKLFPKGSEDQREKLRNADIIEGGRAFFESVTTIAVESVFEALLKRSSMFYDDYIVTKGKVVADNPLHEAGFLYGSKVDLDNIKEIEVFASELVQKHARLLAKKLGKKVERFELPARKIERNAALNEFVSDVVLPVIPQLLNALKGDKDFKLSGTIDNRFPEIHFFLDGILEHLLYYKRLRRGIKRRMASDLAPIKYKIEWVKQELKNAKAKRAAKKSVKSVQKEGKE